jgi:hypothetical protein
MRGILLEEKDAGNRRLIIAHYGSKFDELNAQEMKGILLKEEDAYNRDILIRDFTLI